MTRADAAPAERILAIDTAGPRCTVAWQEAGTRIERRSSAPRAHARHVLALVRAALDEAGRELADVDELAFGEGPGGLTGVRIAASVVQAFALATGARVAAVSNLDALAARMARDVAPGTRLVVAHEAGAGAVCASSYTVLPAGRLRAHDDRTVAEPARLTLPDGPLCVAGSGSARLARPAASAWLAGRPTFARASDLCLDRGLGLGRSVAPEAAQPVYLRHAVNADVML